ncbi:MAG: metal-dependent hydrolase [Actinomycetota bacterium]
MSWATHELENYFIQKHVGLRMSFLACALGAFLPDLLTKGFVYGFTVGSYKIGGSDPIQFHRGWPGAGFTHSILWGVLVSVLVLAIFRSRNWALGLLIGHVAHVVTDINDTAGTMLFFPFSTDTITTGMWRHAAILGRYGDAAAYYSSPGGVWDMFWLVVVLVFARQTLTKEYFRTVIVPADPRVWAWIHRKFKLPERGLVALYRGLLFYGGCRIFAWTLYARFQAHTRWDVSWGGPDYVERVDLTPGPWTDAFWSALIGAACLAVFLIACWKLFIQRLWNRGYDPPALTAKKQGIETTAAT